MTSLTLPGSVVSANAAQESMVQTAVDVTRNGGVYVIDATSSVPAGRELAWAVLTDYEGYSRFVPGMVSSRRLSEQPLRIEQHGEFGILFFVKHVFSTLDVVEYPPFDIRFKAIDGNLRRLETHVNIVERGDRIVLKYHSVIEPDFWVPPLIGSSILRAGIRRKLNSVSDEIVRRTAQETRQ